MRFRGGLVFWFVRPVSWRSGGFWCVVGPLPGAAGQLSIGFSGGAGRQQRDAPKNDDRFTVTKSWVFWGRGPTKNNAAPPKTTTGLRSRNLDPDAKMERNLDPDTRDTRKT